MTAPQYPFADFVADFGALDGTIKEGQGPFQRIARAAADHFLKKYPVKDDRVFRYSRFLMCVNFFEEHVTGLNDETLRDYGSPRVKDFIGEALLRSIHTIFVDIPIAQFDEFTSTEGLLNARRIHEDDDYRRVNK